MLFYPKETYLEGDPIVIESAFNLETWDCIFSVGKLVRDTSQIYTPCDLALRTFAYIEVFKKPLQIRDSWVTSPKKDSFYQPTIQEDILGIVNSKKINNENAIEFLKKTSQKRYQGRSWISK